MAGYYRFQAYAIRGFLALWWLLAVLIPTSWYFNGDPFPRFWWLFHVMGMLLTAIFWSVSVVLLKSAEKK